MSDYLNISDFLLPVNIHELNFDEGYKDGQLGKLINVYNEYEEFPDIDDAQIVLVGCGEQRGSGLVHGQSKAPDVIRRHLSPAAHSAGPSGSRPAPAPAPALAPRRLHRRRRGSWKGQFDTTPVRP